MENHEKSSNELELFKDEYLRDPFREPHFVYENNKNGYFQIHVEHDSSKKEKAHKKENKAHSKVATKETPKKSHAHKPEKVEEGERSLRTILKDAMRQIVASALIFFIGIIVLNWSAYSKIAVNRYYEVMETITGVERTNVLEEVVSVDSPGEVSRISENLETSVNPEVQKKLIPELELEIAPTDNRLIVPRIGQNIPIVRVSSQHLIDRNWTALETEMQEALQDGVVHYPGTSLPGQSGNVVITGHSSYFPWDPGRYKDVFALLHDVVEGDKIVIYYEQDKFVYEIDEIEVVLPEDIDVLKQTPHDKLTLITCTPVGTNLKRLIVSATPITKNGVPIGEASSSSDSGSSGAAR